MGKIKKSISIVVLTFIVVLSSALLMACGKKASSKDVYDRFDVSIDAYWNSDMFGSGMTYEIQTDFSLNNFEGKDADGGAIIDGQNHLAFIGIGLNYIKDNYSYLENLEIKYDYSSLIKKIEKMDKAYAELFVEYANITNLPSTTNYNIVNGYYARYKHYAKLFIEEVYEVAVGLGDFLVNDSELCRDLVVTDKSSEALNIFTDYHLLLLSRDYKDFIITNCQGADLDNELVLEVEDQFVEYAENFFSKMGTDFEISVLVREYEQLLKAINGDRTNISKILPKFSFYDLNQAHQNSLTAYSKTNKKAVVYYNNIDLYYSTTLIELFDYLTNNLA